MHHIYHTEGIIVESRDFGEAGKYYSIFTRDLGMVRASAQGVRKLSSKLRFILQDFSYVKIDLIRGRDFWRVASASKTNQLEQIVKNKATFEVFDNVSRLLKRLLMGEDPNTPLFSDLINGLSILEKSETEEDLRNIEVILVLRILNNLGYIRGGLKLDALVKSPFEKELVLEVSKSRREILSQINKALKETQL
jgi:DNA repair protein RecO (recombination protein O)